MLPLYFKCFGVCMEACRHSGTFMVCTLLFSPGILILLSVRRERMHSICGSAAFLWSECLQCGPLIMYLCLPFMMGTADQWKLLLVDKYMHIHIYPYRWNSQLAGCILYLSLEDIYICIWLLFLNCFSCTSVRTLWKFTFSFCCLSLLLYIWKFTKASESL